MPEPTPVHADRPTVEAGLARVDAIFAILRTLPQVTDDDAERQTQQALEALDPRWTLERWTEIRPRLGLGGAGLKPEVVMLVAAFGPALLTDEPREREQARLDDQAWRRSPEGHEAMRQALGWKEWPQPGSAVELPEPRSGGILGDSVELDAEAARKLTMLAILRHASLSDTLTDLIDDAYELHEWSKRREMRRLRERRAVIGRPPIAPVRDPATAPT